MEKRTEAMSEEESTTRRFARSRAVLQQGLQLNPHSARICQVRLTQLLQEANGKALHSQAPTGVVSHAAMVSSMASFCSAHRSRDKNPLT